MRRWGPVLCALLCLPFLAPAERQSAGEGLLRLKQDFSAIINGLLSCYGLSRDRRILETAIHFGEIKTHPLFELSWGRDGHNAAAERGMLQAAARFRGRFGEGACPPAGSELELCNLAQAYIQANDRLPASSQRAGLDLPGSCRLARIQRRLSPTQLLLKFVLLDERVLLFYIGSDRAGYEFLTVNRAQAVEMIGRLCEPLEDFAQGKVDYLRIHFDMELAHRLYNVLLKRAADLNPQADELFIIPDGELYRLPFEALVTSFNENFQPADVLFSEYQAADYVIQKYKVSYFFSFADFLRPFAGPGKYPYTLAAFGDPLPPGSGRNGSALPRHGASTIADIPSTRLEVLSLEKLFAEEPRRIFLGADFNRRNFSRYAPQAKLVHLATHFFYDEEDPSRSAFLFSSSGSSPDFCSARQVHELRLSAELVILSACESSEKNLLGFKLVSGMTAAIRQAGVRDLIASLWPVDEFSSQVVPLFYREYLRGGNSAAALRSAKLALLDRTIDIRDDVQLSLAHPFLWANYVLYHFYR